MADLLLDRGMGKLDLAQQAHAAGKLARAAVRLKQASALAEAATTLSLDSSGVARATALQRRALDGLGRLLKPSPLLSPDSKTAPVSQPDATAAPSVSQPDAPAPSAVSQQPDAAAPISQPDDERLRVELRPYRGRCAVAKQRLPAGTLLESVSTRPFAAFLHTDQQPRRCARCFSELSAAKASVACRLNRSCAYRYCSAECLQHDSLPPPTKCMHLTAYVSPMYLGRQGTALPSASSTTPSTTAAHARCSPTGTPLSRRSWRAKGVGGRRAQPNRRGLTLGARSC